MVRLLWIAEGAPAIELRDALLDQSYVLLRAEPGERALASAARLTPQAVLLDGGVDTSALRRLRALLPLAVLVVRTLGLRPLDEVLLLGMGADLVADPSEGALLLLARLRRWLQRAPKQPEAPTALRLGRRANALLHALAAHNGGSTSRDELARCLGAGGARGSRWVDTAIWRLRQALLAQGVQEFVIESVRGEGYRMVWRQTGSA